MAKSKKITKNSKKKTSTSKKAPVKVKRLDEANTSSKTNLILVNPPPPVTELPTQEDTPVKTKVVVKDGIVTIQLDE